MELCVADQYDALARMTAWTTRLRGKLQLDRLCMHKRLLPPPAELAGERPGGGQSALNDFLAIRVAREEPSSVLDLGCGFGATLVALAGRHRARYVGVSNASFPLSVGQTLLSDAHQDSDVTLRFADLNAPGTLGFFDAIIALESMAYADCLEATARNAVAALNPGGVLWLIDDWLVSAASRDDPDALAMCASWGRRELYDWGRCKRAFTDQGMELVEDLDLTDQVPATQRPPGRLRRMLLAAMAEIFPGTTTRALAHAFLGGWHLEQLYARGLANYRLAAFQRVDSDES